MKNQIRKKNKINKINIFVVMLAGGEGIRFNNGKFPKQFMKINKKELFLYTLDKFSSFGFKQIVLVAHNKWINYVERILGKMEWLNKVKIIPGGKTRQQSSYNGLEYISKNFCPAPQDIVLIHDSTRPLVCKETISSCIEGTIKYKVTDVCVRATDTIVKGNKGNFISDIPDRNKLWNGQTPQGFQFDMIWKAHQLAKKDNFIRTTDDIGLILRYFPKIKIKIIDGTYDNIKITTPFDLKICKLLLKNEK